MRFRVNATRMEFLRLRKRVELAKRGHKLLQDKLDGLIQKFLEIAKEWEHQIKELEPKLMATFSKAVLASASTSPSLLEEITLLPKYRITLLSSGQNILGVKVPHYEFQGEGDFVSYGFVDTPKELDEILKAFSSLMPDLIYFTKLNKMIPLLAKEIVKIRRRVNALEYILIPELEEAVHSIRLKLTERERDSLVAIMKIVR